MARRPDKGYKWGKPQKERLPIFILCEGKNTESSCFQQFKARLKLQMVEISIIRSIGQGNTIIREAQNRQKAKGRSAAEYWCVFDKDNTGNEEFNKVCNQKTPKIYAVYSNPAFEYWLYLHFNNHHDGGGMSRGDCNNKLQEALIKAGFKNFNVESKPELTEKLFDFLWANSRRERTIRTASSIASQHQLEARSPADSCSNTLVYLLINRLFGEIGEAVDGVFNPKNFD